MAAFNILYDIEVDETSFVDRGAHPLADIVLFKRDGVPGMKTIVELLAKLSPEEQELLKGHVGTLAAQHAAEHVAKANEANQALEAKIAELTATVTKLADKTPDPKVEDPPKSVVKTEEGGVDVDALIQKQLNEALAKQQADFQAELSKRDEANAKLQRALELQVSIRKRGEYVAKAQALQNLTVDTETLVKLYEGVGEDEELAKALDTVISAADAQVGKGNDLLKSVGHAVPGATVEDDPGLAMEEKAKELAKSDKDGRSWQTIYAEDLLTAESYDTLSAAQA